MTTDASYETLTALEAVTSFEVVEVLASHRRLAPEKVEAVLIRSVLGVLDG